MPIRFSDAEFYFVQKSSLVTFPSIVWGKQFRNPKTMVELHIASHIGRHL